MVILSFIGSCLKSSVCTDSLEVMEVTVSKVPVCVTDYSFLFTVQRQNKFIPWRQSLPRVDVQARDEIIAK